MRRLLITLAALVALAAPAAAQANVTHHATVIALHPYNWHGCNQYPQPSTDSWVVKCGGGTGGYVTYAFAPPRNAIDVWMSEYWSVGASHTRFGSSTWVGHIWTQRIHVAAFSSVRFVRVQWAWVTP